MSAATELESTMEVAEHVTEAVIGEKKLGSQIRSCSRGLFWFLGGFGLRLGGSGSVNGGVLVLRIRVRVRVGRRAVTRPVARAATLVATGGRRSCFLHFRLASSLQFVSPFNYIMVSFSFLTILAANIGGKVFGSDLV